MRAFVFTNKALARHAGQFVWLSIDTEKPRNAAFLQKFPVQVWPSFFIVDPASEKIALRWVGGATVPQLEKILADMTSAPDHVTLGCWEGIVASDMDGSPSTRFSSMTRKPISRKKRRLR